MSPFVPKDWQDTPSTVTPITAAALEDMEDRLSDYTDAALVALYARYRQLLRNFTRIPASTGAGAAVYTMAGAAAAQSGTGGFFALYLDPAEHAVSGLATKLRVVAACGVNDAAPTVTFTVGLYPVTNITGGSSVNNPNFGTVVSGSTVAFATPAANSESADSSSGDFTFPAAGWYGLGLALSGAMAANSQALFPYRLEIRNV